MNRKGSLVLLVFSIVIIFLLIINIDFDNNTDEEVIYTETVQKIEYSENYEDKSDILVYENEVIAIKVLNETNKYRKSGKPLVLDTNLSKIASIRALELANSKELSHIRDNGRYYSDLLEQYNIKATFSGENIAKGYTTPEEVCEAWKNSKGHYANMIKDKYNKMGVGFYTKNGITYWVQIFSD